MATPYGKKKRRRAAITGTKTRALPINSKLIKKLAGIHDRSPRGKAKRDAAYIQDHYKRKKKRQRGHSGG